MLLEMPDFSYSFGGLANAADLPGLNVTIKAALDKVAKANVDKMFELNHYKVIRQSLVWPNRLSYQFPFDEVEILTTRSLWIYNSQTINLGSILLSAIPFMIL